MIERLLWICFADDYIAGVKTPIIEEIAEDGTVFWRLLIDLRGNEKLVFLIKSKYNIDVMSLPNRIYQKKYPKAAFHQSDNPNAHVNFHCDCSFDGTIVKRVSEIQRVTYLEHQNKTLLGIIAKLKETVSKMGGQEDEGFKGIMKRIEQIRKITAPIFIQPKKPDEKIGGGEVIG